MQELDSSSLISKNELKKQFASELPSIFGGLLTLTVQAKQEIKLIRLNHSTRTVDFDLFACGVAMALGVDPGKFMRSRLDAMGQLSCYGKNKPFFDSFINLIESSNNKINLSAQELADTLAGELEEDISPIALGKRLADYEDTLDDLNIPYSKKRDKSGTQYEIIRKTPEQSDLVVYPKHCHECQHYEYTDDYKQYCHLFADFIDPDPKGVRCTEYTFAEMDWDEDELKIESDIQEVDLPDMNALHGTPKPVEPNELVPQKVTGGYQSVFEDEM